MENNPAPKENAILILTKNNEKIAVLESTQNNEKDILFKLFIAISILFSFDVFIVMKDFWKTIQLLSSGNEGKDFIKKHLEQSTFADKKVEISSDNKEGEFIFQKVLQSDAFYYLASNLKVLEGTYIDYKVTDDPLVPPSIRNLAENNFNISVQSIQSLFQKFTESTSPIRHCIYNDEFPDFDKVYLDLRD